MLKFLLLFSLIFASVGLAAAVEGNPKTPSEALKLANEPIKKLSAAGDYSAESRAKASQEQIKLAKSFAPLFKIEDLAGEETLAFGQLLAIAGEHASAEKAFVKYLADAKAANIKRARQELFRALTNQKKYAESVAVAETIIDESFDLIAFSEIEMRLQPLRLASPAEARKIARRTLAKILASGGNSKLNEGEVIFARIALVGSLQTAAMSDNQGIDAEGREFLREFNEKFNASGFAQNKSIKSEIEGVLARYNLIGNAAPPIQHVDTIGDAKQTLDAYKGKVVVLDFLAHWCFACIEAFPMYNNLREKYQSKGLEIVGVTNFYGYFGAKTNLAQADEKAEVAKLRENRSVRYGFLFTDKASEKAYGIVGLPATVVIDRKGIVRFAREGSVSAEELERLIEKLLAE